MRNQQLFETGFVYRTHAITFQTTEGRNFDLLIDGEVYGASHSTLTNIRKHAKQSIDKLITAGIIDSETECQQSSDAPCGPYAGCRD